MITDALSMGGITAYGGTGSIAVRAIRAGVDLLLMPPQPTVAIRSVAAAVHRGTISEGRISRVRTTYPRAQAAARALPIREAPAALSMTRGRTGYDFGPTIKSRRATSSWHATETTLRRGAVQCTPMASRVAVQRARMSVDSLEKK